MSSILLTLFLTIIMMSGCAQQVTVTALQPAVVDRAAMTKRIALTPFKNDNVGLSDKIESILSTKKVNAKPYFTTISRSDINRILYEQKLQNSGLLDESESVQLGELLGAQALISGTVSSATESNTHYRATRVKCEDKKCKSTYEYTVPCVKKVISLAAQIKMVDIQKGDIIFSDSPQKSKTWKHCSDDSNTLPSKAAGLEQLSLRIAKEFTHKLTPHYKTYSVTLLEDPDLKYSEQQEEVLKNALLYIEHKRYDKAEILLSELLEETGDRSYVAAYNLGVVKEVQGKYDEARQLYGLADELTMKPVEEINTAILRIEHSISRRKQAQEQMQR